MSTSPRNPPRYLPTLTEVVQTPDSSPPPSQATPDFEELVQAVMQRLEGVIEQRLREELQLAVRQAVTDAMTALASGDKPK